MKTVVAGLALASVAALSTPVAAATLTGVSFTGGYFVPASTTPYDAGSCTPSPFTVGAGVDTVCQIEGVTTFATDFGDTSLRVDFATLVDNPTITAQPFSGLVYSTTASLGQLGLTGFTINAATTFAGFTADRVLFEDNRIGLNLQGLTYRTGDVIALDFQTAAVVPEPGVWVMMVLGFGAIGLTLRRRTGRSAIARAAGRSAVAGGCR